MRFLILFALSVFLALPVVAADGDFHLTLAASNTDSTVVGAAVSGQEAYAVLTEADPYARIAFGGRCQGYVAWDSDIDLLTSTAVSTTVYQCARGAIPTEIDTGAIDIHVTGAASFVRQAGDFGTDGWVAGDYGVATGFPDDANNGLFRVVTVSTDTLITSGTMVDGATMVNETPSNDLQRIRRVIDLDHCSRACSTASCTLTGDDTASLDAVYGIERPVAFIFGNFEANPTNVGFAAAGCKE